MRNLCACALILLLGLTSAACFQIDTLVRLKADGSGTLEERIFFTNAALEQMKQLGALGGNGAGNFDPLSEDNARAMASQLGAGVTYVSSTPIATADGQGRAIVFAFQDIREMQLTQQPPGADALAGGAGYGFTLTRQPNADALLTIHMPPSSGLPGAGPGATLPPPEQLALIKQMLAGAHIGVAIEPAGTLVKTNSPYVDGNRVTLVDLDLDRLFADDTTIAKLQAAPDSAAAQAVLAAVPGIKIVTTPDVSIEFLPAR